MNCAMAPAGNIAGHVGVSLDRRSNCTRRLPMYNPSRRQFFLTAALATAAFGLNSRLFIPSVFAGTGIDPEQGVYKYKVGDVEVTALYDGIWRKPHDPAFIKNASVAETKEALAKAGLTTEYMPIPLTEIGRAHV